MGWLRHVIILLFFLGILSAGRSVAVYVAIPGLCSSLCFGDATDMHVPVYLDGTKVSFKRNSYFQVLSCL